MSLEVKGLSVRFGGIKALTDVSIRLERGEVLALIGPNGAGKSTLINALSGHVPVASGAASLDGHDLIGRRPDRRVAMGLGRSFQTPRLDPAATAEENVRVGLYRSAAAGLPSALLRTPRHYRSERQLRERSEEIVERFELGAVAGIPAAELPVWQLRLVEVARSVALGAAFLMLDEPAAGLDPESRDVLARHVRGLRDSGVGVLLVEHNFAFVRSLSDRVEVLHQGKSFASGSAAEVAADPRVIQIYLGVEVTNA